MKITESHIEELTIQELEKLGWVYAYGMDIAPDGSTPERENYKQVILQERLRTAIQKINPRLPQIAQSEALQNVLRLSSPDLIQANEIFHNWLTNGIEVEHTVNNESRGDKCFLIDFENSVNNDFLVVNQFTVSDNNQNKRPDIILFVNGIPLVVIELKNPVDENATIHKAFTQLQNYMDATPTLYYYNALMIASDGLECKCGTVSSSFSRFMAWKTKDGKQEASHLESELLTLVNGMLSKETLLDLIRHFIVYETTKREDTRTKLSVVETIKKVAAYHQYYAVNKAVNSTLTATAANGDRKGGVVWHTQGSGKSLSMVFYTGKLVLTLNNPTVVVITDRNDLDEQLFDTFAACRSLLRQQPVMAESRNDLREKLKVAGGGIVFTTIQKFFPEDEEDKFPLLSERKNIVVIADEAHRTQYGFEAKTRYLKDDAGSEIGSEIAYGFAKHLRDAVPKATFIGFTGTPVELTDRNTKTVFGEYVDVYDIQQAVNDGATVRIYYESRLAKIHLSEKEKDNVDDELSVVAEDAPEYVVNTAKAKWTRLEAIVGHPERIKAVAKDIVNHFEDRQQVFEGKAMIVAMSRRIAVALYAEIVNLKPEWHHADDDKGGIKVIMTGSSSDPKNYQPHIRNKERRKAIGERLKDPNDGLQMVIVRDMWLTGFDAPCLHTLYIDKPMQGHNLMQAIARVNRVYKDKPGGLIVDYIGIASDLKKALAVYTQSGGKGEPTLDISAAVNAMEEKLEVIRQMMHGYNYHVYFKAGTAEKLTVILTAEEHVLSLENGKERFIKEVTALSKVFALCKSTEEAEVNAQEIAFFQAVKARLAKFTSVNNGKTDEEIETAIRQIIDKAVVSEGVIDIFDAAGIKKPDISILSDEFLEEIKGMQHKNLALELLRRILNDEIKVRSKYNIIQGRKLSEMLENAIKKYQNKLLTAVEIINEVIEIAKEVREAEKRGEKLKLTNDEVAFYDALLENPTAKAVMQEESLREMARLLVDRVRKNASIDWTLKENVRSRLRVIVKRILREYGYPPDDPLTKEYTVSVDRVLEQAEMFAGEWS
ncbi:MAG: type I restriction endonuclease subunit R [Chitinophagales bacterium]|nr:type I restriction endonuclease subunit R [Chitinophagales bacterium]